MSDTGTTKRWLGAFTRISGLIARPVHEAQGEGGVVVQPYRGYGSRSEVFLIGGCSASRDLPRSPQKITSSLTCAILAGVLPAVPFPMRRNSPVLWDGRTLHH